MLSIPADIVTQYDIYLFLLLHVSFSPRSSVVEVTGRVNPDLSVQEFKSVDFSDNFGAPHLRTYATPPAPTPVINPPPPPPPIFF